MGDVVDNCKAVGTKSIRGRKKKKNHQQSPYKISVKVWFTIE